MQWREFIGKRTWIGLLIFHIIIVLLCGIGAALILRGLLPSYMQPYTYTVLALAAFLATRAAVSGQSQTFLQSMLFLLLLMLTLRIVGAVCMTTAYTLWPDPGALAAILGGGIAAHFLCRKGKSSKKRRKKTYGRS